LCEKCCPTFANVKAKTIVGSDSEGVLMMRKLEGKAVEEMGCFNGFLKFYN